MAREHMEKAADHPLSTELADRLQYFIQKKMTLKQLRIIVTLHRHKTMVAASRELSMTSANISLCVRDIETLLDCKIFLRRNGFYVPTLCGRMLIELGTRLAESCEYTIRKAHHLSGISVPDELTIGYIGPITACYAYELWSNLLAYNTGLNVNVIDLSALEQQSSLTLEQLKADVIFSSRGPHTLGFHDRWESRAFYIRHFHFLVACNENQAPPTPDEVTAFLLPTRSGNIVSAIHDHIAAHFPGTHTVSYCDAITGMAFAQLPRNTVLVVSDKEKQIIERNTHFHTLSVMDNQQIASSLHIQRERLLQLESPVYSILNDMTF